MTCVRRLMGRIIRSRPAYLALSLMAAAALVIAANLYWSPTAVATDRDPGKDIDLATGNNNPRGIWSNGTTVWVADSGNDDKLFAYTLSDGTRDADKDIDLHTDNELPGGIWSDGTTVWVADSGDDDKLFAYTLSDGTRDSGKEFDLHTDNESPEGIWSNGTTVWVADSGLIKLFAYTLSDGTRDADKDIDLHSSNTSPVGIWSDGTTVWVVESGLIPKVFAYTLDDKKYTAGRDVDLGSAVVYPQGIWSDGTTVWVSNIGSRKLFAYNLPPLSTDAALKELEVKPKNIIGFDPERTSYDVGVDPSVAFATVSATANDDSAMVKIVPDDAIPGTEAHDVALVAGQNEVKVTVTAQDGITIREYTVWVNRGVIDQYGWQAGADLDGLIAAGNRAPRGIWSDGVTAWVADWVDDKLFAYSLSDGARDAGKDVDLVSGNDFARGIWSDGTTMWVADALNDKLFAYTLSGGARDSGKEFDLHSDNASPQGIWSNGTTIWVADSDVDKLFAYTLSDGARDADKEFDLHSDNNIPAGIWSDGTTVWVADSGYDKLFAYSLSDGARDAGKDIDLHSSNTDPEGIWSEGVTVWVADDRAEKFFAYNLLAKSTDAALKELKVGPKNIIGFDPERTSYDVGVDPSVAFATVSATANDDSAMVEIEPDDAIPGTEAHDVALVAGRNEVKVTVTAEDGLTTREYTVWVNRGVIDQYGWQAGADLDGLIAAGNRAPQGIWSDGVTAWVADWVDDKLFAYSLSDGARDAGKDVDLVSGNGFARGIWSDGTTMWVADALNDKLFAYTLSGGARDSGKEFDLHSDNASPQGIWSNGTTIWVADSDVDKLFAYTLSDGARDADKEFDLHSDNNNPVGIWSNEETVWVADWVYDKLFAYTLSDGARDADKEFDLHSSNTDPQGIWSEGVTVWVADDRAEKFFAYNLLAKSTDAALKELKVGPKNIIGFDPERTSYDVGVDPSVALATVSATANDDSAMVEIEPDDAVPGTDEHDVALVAGRNEVKVTVTAEDGLTTREYTVSVNRGVTDAKGWQAGADLDGLIAAGNHTPRGIWSDGVTVWVVDGIEDKLFAYSLSDGARDSGKEFDLHSSNTDPWGIWSNGETVWVVDLSDDKLFAYTLAGGARDSDKDIDLHSDNARGRGIWSDGTTVWVLDSGDVKLFAYTLSDGARDSGKDIALHSSNRVATGIWSNELTVWVLDSGDVKLFAYTLDGGVRKNRKEFALVTDNASPQGIWSNGTTIWVADDGLNKLFAYNLPPKSTDAALKELRVRPKNIIGFDPERTSYDVGVDPSVTLATVSATANDDSAMVEIEPDDAVPGTDEHDVALVAGRNEVKVTVTAEDGLTTREYTVSVNRGVTDAKGWQAGADLDGLIAAGNHTPLGIWSDGVTVWVVDGIEDKLFAYSLSDGARDSGKEFDLHSSNTDPWGIWSNGETVWVADLSDDKLYAYTLAGGARDSDKDIDLHSDNPIPTGIWSDGTTVWVKDSYLIKLFAYTLSDGTRDTDKEFDLDSDHGDAAGIWSNGTTVWVADSGDSTAYAYTLSDGARDADKDVDLHASNRIATGIWSNEATVWVVDTDGDKLFAYNIPFYRIIPNYYIRSITVPWSATIANKALPEEYISVRYPRPFAGNLDVVAPGHWWAPSGLWGDPVQDLIWVVDPHHWGIHPFVLSEFKKGNVSRSFQVDNSDFDFRFNYNCHFSENRASGNGNPSLTVMWGDADTIWVANSQEIKLDAYDRDGETNDSECFVQTVTSYNDDNSYVSSKIRLKSRFQRDSSKDIDAFQATFRGVWSDGTTMWLSGPPGGIYKVNLSTNRVTVASGFDAHGTSYGIWSDGTIMWVATESGWLRAYNLRSGFRNPRYDIRIRKPSSMPPGDIWSDGETMWVTNGIGAIDAYRLPARPYATNIGRSLPNSLKAINSDGIVASFASAPVSHDGENEFNVRVAFSHDVKITSEDMRDHALLIIGGDFIDAARVRGSGDLWEMTLKPHGLGPVSMLIPMDRACTELGALCTADGRPVTIGAALLVQGPPLGPNGGDLSGDPDSPPETPDRPQGSAVFVGGVDLEWNDVPGADSYDVQQYWDGRWTELPADGVTVALYGAGAIISGLDPDESLWFRVRSVNAHGASEWSDSLQMSSTSQHQLGQRARPDNEAATGAPVISGTAEVGETLRVDITGIEDGNGLDRVRFRYQWVADDGEEFTDIAGATTPDYTVMAAEMGGALRVRVTFTDRGGYTETLTSAATEVVALIPNSPATGLPFIGGTTKVGETLTADTSGIGDDDGMDNAVYRYQWMRRVGDTDTDIAGAIDSVYTLMADDTDSHIRVRVTFTDDHGFEEALTSESTAAVIARVNNKAEGVPFVRGEAAVGETLMVDTTGIHDDDGMEYAAFSYQWIRHVGDSDTDIAGATSGTYTLASDNEGDTVAVRVRFTDDFGFEETLTSEPTAAVTMAPLRLRSASVIEDKLVVTYVEALDLSVTLPASAFTVTVEGSDRQVDGVTIQDSAVVLKLVSPVLSGETVQVGYSRPAGPDYIRARALGLPAKSFSGLAVSNETAGPQPPAAPNGLTATANGDGTISLSWTDPADPTVEGYQILRRRSADDPLDLFEVLVNDTGNAATSFVDRALEAWTRYEYRVRARSNDGLSEESDTARVWNRQGGTTLVSNSTQRPLSKMSVDTYDTTYLQGFTTGHQDATVESITLLGPTGVDPTSRISLEIYEAVGKTEPGKWLHTLTAPGRLKDKEHATFAAHAAHPVELSANTAYFLMVRRVNASFQLSTTVSDGEDAESASGWLLADSCLLEDGTRYIECAFSRALRISINGSERTRRLPFVNLSDGVAVAGEGSAVEFTVTLSGETAEAVTVEYATSDGTATSDANAEDGQDYTPVSGEKLTIEAGETEGTISVFTVDDDSYESNETFTLTLSGPSDNARLGSIATATATIINDDADMTLPPTAPQGLMATANDDGTVSLSWVDPEDTSITGYQILRRRPAVERRRTNVILVDDTGSAATSFEDTQAIPGTFYVYRVRARNGNGLSGESNYANVLSKGGGSTLVSNIGQVPALTRTISIGGANEPSSLLQGFTTGSHDAQVESVTLAGPVNVGSGSEVSVGIHEKGENALPGTQLYTLSLSGTLTSGEDASFTVSADSTLALSANTDYYLKVDLVSGSLGLSSSQSDGEDGGSAPRWRLDDECLIGGSTPSEYSDCESYEALRVSIDGVEVLAGDPQPPAAPRGLVATADEDGTVSLIWDDPDDPSITGYQIWRAMTGSSFGSTIIANDTGSADTSFADTETTAGTPFTYRIRARNAFGTSADSDTAIVETPTVFILPDSADNTTLVSNRNQNPMLTSALPIGVEGTDPPIYLQGFRTGTLDAEVESITLMKLRGVSDEDELSVGIYEKAGHTSPGDRLYTLTHPGALAPGENATFTPEQGLSVGLSANTAYFVKVERVSGSLNLSTTLSDAEDGESAPGWSLDNACRKKHQLANSFTICRAGRALRISINGFEGSSSPIQSASDDASLSALNLVDPDGATVALNPLFDPATAVYTATVPNSMDSVTLSATKNHAGASVAVLTGSGASSPDEATVDIVVGENLIRAKVTAEDGETVETYKVTVTREGPSKEVDPNDPRKGVGDSPSTGLPTIDGTVRVGETLTADTSGIVDANGLKNAAFTYQWLRNDGNFDADIAGATDSGYTLVDADEGLAIKVRVTVTDDLGNETTLTSAATGAVAAKPNSPATGLPLISGTARVGETLTADTSGIDDDDGMDSAVFSYQWTAAGADIGGATGSSYTLTRGEQGKTVSVRVTFTDDEGNTQTLTSAATGAVAAKSNSPATGLPLISGTARVGETLTADTSGIGDDDGMDSAVFSYQWTAAGADIGGATGSSYTLTRGEQGKTVSVRVTFTDDEGNTETLTSAATGAVAAKPNSPATGLPLISGTARVGETLTADTSGIGDDDGMDSAVFSYQWTAAGADIGGATGSSYTLTRGEQGKTVSVRVTFTDDEGNTETLTSAATGEVAAKPNSPATGLPLISGTARVGETLTADTSGIGDDDGMDSAVFSYQWVITDRGSYLEMPGETGETYTLLSIDRGLYVLVRVTFTDDAGDRETLTSKMTDVVAAAY